MFQLKRLEITKRWEGCLGILVVHDVAISAGFSSHSTSEGLILRTGVHELYDENNNINGGSAPELNSSGILLYGKLALIATYSGITKE